MTYKFSVIYMALLSFCWTADDSVLPVPQVITLKSVRQDYDQIMDCVCRENRSPDDLSVALIKMINIRETIDREQLLVMHVSIPDELKPLIFGKKYILSDLFQSFSLESGSHNFTFSYDRKEYKVLTVQEVTFWPKEDLIKFVDENYKAIFYITCVLNHLNRNQLELDPKDLEALGGIHGVNKPFIRTSFSTMANSALQYRENFNDNVRFNLELLGIPEHLWEVAHQSSLSLGARDWFEECCSAFVKTCSLLGEPGTNLDLIADSDMLYVYFIMHYRMQTAFSISTNILDHISELYDQQVQMVSASQKQTSVWDLKALERQQADLIKQTDAAAREKNKLDDKIKFQRKTLKTAVQRLEKLQRQVVQLKSDLSAGLDRVISLKQDKARLISENARLAESFKSAQQNLNLLTKTIIAVMSEIKTLETRENKVQEFQEVQSKLDEIQLQLSQLEGAYQAYYKDSRLIRLQEENRKLESEGADLDAEVARLEAELKSK